MHKEYGSFFFFASFSPKFSRNFQVFFKWQERRLFLKQFFILSMKLWFSSYKMVLIKSALKLVFFVSNRFADINRKIKISKVSTKWCLHFKKGVIPQYFAFCLIYSIICVPIMFFTYTLFLSEILWSFSSSSVKR